MGLQEDIQQIADDTQIYHDYIHGGEGDAVITEAGEMDSLGEKNAQVDTAISNMQSTVASAISDAEDAIAATVSELTTITDRGAWVTSTAYAVKDLVTYDSVKYICLAAHTSGTWATDLAAGRWAVYQGDGKLLGASVTYTVGATGDFSTINAALAFVSEYRPVYDAAGIRVTIQLQTGFTVTEQIIIDAVDLSFCSLEAVDATVYIDASYITELIRGPSYATRPFLGAINGGKSPIINCLFEFSASWTSDHNKSGFSAQGAGSAIHIGSGGIRLALYGAIAGRGGMVGGLGASTTVLTGCRFGCVAEAGGLISGVTIDASDSGENGVQASNGGRIEAYTLTCEGCDAFMSYAGSGYGVYASYGGSVSAVTLNCEGCAVGGVYSFGGRVSAYRIDAMAGASDAGTDIVVADGGYINRNRGTGGVSQTAGAMTANGYISA